MVCLLQCSYFFQDRDKSPIPKAIHSIWKYRLYWFVELHANTNSGLCQYLWGRTCQEASTPTEINGFTHIGLVPNFSDHIHYDEKSSFNTQGRNSSFYLLRALTSSETVRMVFVLPELQISSLGLEFVSGPA